MKKKTLLLMLVLLVITIPFSVKIKASYNYTPWIRTIDSANSMTVHRIINSSNLVDESGNAPGIEFDNLRDVFVYEDEIFISDAKNNRVYVLNENFEYVREFPNSDGDIMRLDSPQGIYVINDRLYVADMNNERIAIYNVKTGNLVKRIQNPDDELFSKTPFRPQRIVVDENGRMIVVAQDIYEGILEFDADGNFVRFFGTNTIQLSFFETLMFNLSSKKQKAQMALNLQTAFTSIDRDKTGNIYAVARNEIYQPVKKLNFKGENVLINNGYFNISGDARYPNFRERVPLGPSSIIDIASHDDDKRFTILDSKRGRLFTYDIEGHLLYIFGGLGTQTNNLQGPTSVTYYGDNILVTDNVSKSIVVYEPTRFGALINEATEAFYEMDYDRSKELWEQVLQLNSNYFLAYAGIGKTQLRNEEWEEAAKNLKLGYDYYNYSKAYEKYRNQKLEKVLPVVLIVIIAGAVYGLVASIRKSVKRGKEVEE